MRRIADAPEKLSVPLIIALALAGGACGTPAPEADAPAGDAEAAAPAVEPVSPSALAEAESATPDATTESGGVGEAEMDMAMDQEGTGGAAGTGDAAGATAPIDHSDPDHTHETRAEPFAADAFGADNDDYGAVFTPDGQTAFFTRAVGGASVDAIYSAQRTANGWSEPAVAPFSGEFRDKEPYVAPDGRRVYFASQRPIAGGAAREELDLFYVERAGDGWGEPVRLAATSTSFNEDYPTVAADGTLVFSRSDADDKLDLWIAHPGADGIEPPRPFDRPINTVYPEADPWISADATTIVFSSQRIGSDAQGQGDLYVIHRRSDGWTPPRTIGFDVNTVAHEYGPTLSADGTTFYFARGFGGELWRVPVSMLANFAAR